MGTRIGFVASEKGAVEKECDVGLGLRMQTTSNKSSSFSRKKMTTMMMDTPHHHHHHNHDDNNDDDEPTLLSASGGFGEEHGCVGGDACNGPLLSTTTTANNNNNHHQAHVVASMSDIYDVVGSTDFMPLPCSAETLISHNSSGVMVNANVRGVVVPNFTAAQRQELERQTMIYKYMMASVPVPPQLLIPISKTNPNFPHLHSNTRSKGSLELGVPNTSDPEPWRCRRTDGKKWRCSRNVVPDQKYCERHSHKSRPRSRKPVEQLHSHFFTTTTTTNNNNNNDNNNTTLSYLKSSGLLDQREKHLSLYSSTSHDQTRGLEWFMKGEEANSSNQQGSFFTRPQSERAFDFYNNNNYQSLQSQGLNEQFSSLIDPKLVPGQTRHFIDAWSTNDKVLPYSSLSLSMQGGNNGTTSEESENSQMGFGIEGDNLKSQIWLNNTISWNGSISTSTSLQQPQPQPQPGGPLAEALCLGIAGSARTTTTSSRSSS